MAQQKPQSESIGVHRKIPVQIGTNSTVVTRVGTLVAILGFVVVAYVPVSPMIFYTGLAIGLVGGLTSVAGVAGGIVDWYQNTTTEPESKTSTLYRLTEAVTVWEIGALTVVVGLLLGWTGQGYLVILAGVVLMFALGVLQVALGVHRRVTDTERDGTPRTWRSKSETAWRAGIILAILGYILSQGWAGGAFFLGIGLLGMIIGGLANGLNWLRA